MSDRIPELPLDAFAARVTERLRYCDTDRQGHINNTVFAALCEAGRMEIFRDQLETLEGEGKQFALVRLAIDFRREMHWPGDAEIGTGVMRIGTSSVALRQSIHCAGVCAAMADSVVVLMDIHTRKPAPISQALRSHYENLMIQRAPA
ncbi:acyl-CoA thioesterase [Amaricoccus macauensis]|uniref:acyl-CoA thioesterase n=1 Tax=Amaricoccus macauensis TaxID=57001 RepID=UPI003C797F1B